MLQIIAEAQRSQRYLEEFGFTVTPANAGVHIYIVSVQK
jgi:hypothetical protein